MAAWALVVLLPAPSLAAWSQPAGGSSPINSADDRDGFRPSLAEIDGVPWVAWAEDDPVNREIRVARLNAAGTAWEEVVGGPSPINRLDDAFAVQPSLAGIDGVPYVAWAEDDPVNREIRVARLNAAGTAWEEVVGGASPINHAADMNAGEPSLTAIGGVPYVAWEEFDSVNREIRVARLNAAGTAWEQVVGGASPINQAADRSTDFASLTGIDGVPHVAWEESDGVNTEIRVARLNAAGTAWEKVGQTANPASPINQAGDMNARFASLIGIGGVPHVAWQETDGTNIEIRVSRLNAAGTAWEQVVGGASPINQAADRDAIVPRLTQIGGVPYVAWQETDGTNFEIRVGRLEPDFLAVSEVVGTTTATLSAEVRTYGVAYPIGFEYGLDAGFGSQAGPLIAQSGNTDSTAVSQTVSELAPATTYSWRAFGTDGRRSTSVSATRTFTTAPDLAPAISAYRLSRSTFAAAAKGPSVRSAARRRRKPKVGTTVRYRLSEPASVRFTVERAVAARRVRGKCRKPTRKNTGRKRCRRYRKLRGSFKHAGGSGRNAFKFTGRLRGRRLARGRYRLVARATNAAGSTSRSKRVKFRIVKR